jgi:hypothetical protein
MEEPVKKYFRLFPGNQVRLRYGYVVSCTGFEKDKMEIYKLYSVNILMTQNPARLEQIALK